MLIRVLLTWIFVGCMVPGAVVAQGLGLGGRVGTLGLGGEVAVGLTDRIVVRGGLGVVPYDPPLTFGDLEVDLSLPTVYNVGVDLYLNGAMRIGGGVLFRASDLELTGDYASPQEIGGTTFTPQELGTLTGVFDSSHSVPYLLLGFGRHTEAGAGLFVDFGVVFMGDPDVKLGARGGMLGEDMEPLKSALDREAAEFEADMRDYLRFWPILSIGLRLGAY